MSFLDKYFPLKFRKRIKHDSSNQYLVQYAYYRFIPVWKSLYHWHSGKGYKFRVSRSVEYCEKLINEINSIEDAEAYNQPTFQKEKDDNNMMKERKRKTNPYKVRYFD